MEGALIARLSIRSPTGTRIRSQTSCERYAALNGLKVKPSKRRLASGYEAGNGRLELKGTCLNRPNDARGLATVLRAASMLRRALFLLQRYVPAYCIVAVDAQ